MDFISNPSQMDRYELNEAAELIGNLVETVMLLYYRD
jgi:hypothetical protein